MAPVVPSISDLAEFSAIRDQAFTQTFMFNLEKIFNYQVSDIPKIFKERKLPITKELRSELLNKVATKLSDFANRVPLSRKFKDDVVSDILKLGQALARPNISNELESIYETVVIRETLPVSNELNPEDLKDTDTLVSVILKMKLDLDAATASILTLKGENESLSIENNGLKLRLGICEASLGILDKSIETSSSKPTSSPESSSSDIGNDSESDAHHASKRKTLRKKVKKNIKSTSNKNITCESASPQKSHVVPLAGGNITTYAFIGGVSQACSRQSIKDHISNIDLNVSLDDIQILNTRRDLRAFKVAIPHSDLQKLITSVWPAGIKVERFDSSKYNTQAKKVLPSNLPKSKYSMKKQQNFRKPYTSFKPKHDRYPKRQNGYRRGGYDPVWSSQYSDDFREYYHQADYQQNHQGGYHQGYRY